MAKVIEGARLLGRMQHDTGKHPVIGENYNIMHLLNGDKLVVLLYM